MAEVASILGVPQSGSTSSASGIPTVALGRDRRFREEAIARTAEQLAHGAARLGT